MVDRQQPSPLLLADEAAALASGGRAWLDFMMIRQHVLCLLTANYWWARSRKSGDAAQMRGEFYDRAAVRALDLLWEDEQKAARDLYHSIYIGAPRAERDTLCLAYVHLNFIIV